MTETKEKKDKSLEQKLIDLHPKFLDTVKDVYPLAVLSSLCIAVTAFSQQTYPQIQPYSITAAGMFLIAFIASFIFKIVQTDFLAFISYCSTALAVLMLILVVNSFAAATPTFSKTMIVIPVGLMGVIFLSGLLTMGRIMTKSRLKATRFSGLATFVYFLFVLILIIVWGTSTFYESKRLDIVLNYLMVPSLFVMMIPLFVTVYFISKERKEDRIKKTESSNE